MRKAKSVSWVAVLVILVSSGIAVVGGRFALSGYAAPGDLYISALHCDSSPEYVRIENIGSTSESLTGVHIQSDPSQDYDLSAHVASIAAGQVLEFQSGTGSADNPGAGIYKLTGNSIYRNGDSTDYARLLRSDASTNQVNCGSTPVIPGPSPSPTPTPPPGDIKGDADCNGFVQVPDAIQGLLSVAGFNPGLCVETLGNVDCTDGVAAQLRTLRPANLH